jgi:hypothetical protein
MDGVHITQVQQRWRRDSRNSAIAIPMLRISMLSSIKVAPEFGRCLMHPHHVSESYLAVDADARSLSYTARRSRRWVILGYEGGVWGTGFTYTYGGVYDKCIR